MTVGASRLTELDTVSSPSSALKGRGKAFCFTAPPCHEFLSRKTLFLGSVEDQHSQDSQLTGVPTVRFICYPLETKYPALKGALGPFFPVDPAFTRFYQTARLDEEEFEPGEVQTLSCLT